MNPVVGSQVEMDDSAIVGETGLSQAKIKQILFSSADFNQHKGLSDITSIEALLISDGKGFLSQVFRVCVKFSDANVKKYEFIVKIPFPAGLQQIIENEKADGKPVIDQIVVDGHNTEVEFYEHIIHVPSFPAPKVYASEKIVIGKQNGLLIMQDLSKCAEPLGFNCSANVNQVLNVASALADLQFNAQQKEFAQWWKTLRVTIHLEEIYTKYTDGAMPELEQIPEIYELLPSIPIVFDQAFGYYCLLTRPEKYNALTFCHGDTQPNNVMFKINKKGELTDQLAVLIDWQLVFCGNPLFDLARFLTFGVDESVRKKVEIQAFNVYYSKLGRLYINNQKTRPFTYKQGFELFELALCQQVGFIVTFLGIFHMAHRQMEKDVPESFKILVDRGKYCIRRGIQIIKKYNLDKLKFKSNL